jgi:Rrf2 family protein
MISSKSKYAIRAVIYVAYKTQGGNSRVGGKHISEYLDMPLAFTVKILQELAKGDIISSSKGPGGGFYLSEENKKRTLMDLISIFGDESFFSNCALGLIQCSDERPCPIHHDFGTCRNNIKQIFQSRTLSQLALDIEKEVFFLK